MQNRRQFTKGVAAMSLLFGAGCSGIQKTQLRSVSKVGIQTYTLRFMFDQDPLETFKLIKNSGYDYVELNGGNFEKNRPDQVKSMLDETGLYAPASHISLDALRNDLDGLVQLSRTFDMKYLVVPWIDENARQLEDWKAHAALLNESGQQLASEGVGLAYHNHQFEFDDLGGGTTAMDIILGECEAENLAIEIDFFWASLADADIKQLFKDNPGRFKLCHIKDMAPNKADFANASYENLSKELMQNVGEGIIPFEDFLALNDISGMEYFIAEHDNPAKPYGQAIQTSLDAIRSFRF